MRRSVVFVSLLAIACCVWNPAAAPLIGRAFAVCLAACILTPMFARGVGQIGGEPTRSPFLPARAKATEAPLPAGIMATVDQIEKSRSTQFLPVAVAARMADVAANRLRVHHRLDVAERSHHDAIRRQVSPLMADLVLSTSIELPHVPAALAPRLLAELEAL